MRRQARRTWNHTGNIALGSVIGLIIAGSIAYSRLKNKNSEHIEEVPARSIENFSEEEIEKNTVEKEEKNTDFVFCTQCGAKLKVNDTFCSICGGKT